MSHIACKTKGGSLLSKKPRVYFTCHPDDFNKYFKKICEDIFRTHDCAIYYTEDMTENIAEQDIEIDIGSNNLLVIPVTYKLLATPNRAMDVDFPYAKKTGIPILPIMMEYGIDELYSRADRFGELQYLKPLSNDDSEICYSDKLKKYLESTLISAEMANRIRAAFDAYIFLSYRKKDRQYANELMKLIHRNPECRDIAIWYDEFLTPGESFKDNIEKMMSDSKLFALLVTPNLLEEPFGKPNYVMEEEYPTAKNMGLPIVPAEMKNTDKDALGLKFKDIPNCIDPYQEQAFSDLLLTSLSKIARSENNNAPEHNFLIGLAYYEGIDVEVDRKRGLDLITKAADADLLEAVMWLYNMYYGKCDYYKAITFAKKIVQIKTEEFGESHLETLREMVHLALDYATIGEWKKEFDLFEKIYNLSLEAFGETDPFVLHVLHLLGSSYETLGYPRKELEINQKIYEFTLKLYGKKNSKTIEALEQVAYSYISIGENEKALQLKKKAYYLNRKYLGKKHHHTIFSLESLAQSYGFIGNSKKKLRLDKKIYSLRCRVDGVENIYTIGTLDNIASAYQELGKLKKAIRVTEKVYIHRCNVLGETNYEAMMTLSKLAQIYYETKNHRKLMLVKEKVKNFENESRDESVDSIFWFNSLAEIYTKLREYEKAIQFKTQMYQMSRNLLGDEHIDTMRRRTHLADTYYSFENYRKAFEIMKELYALYCKVLGKDNVETIGIQEKLITIEGLLNKK